jgi:LPXTG-site transpeptidase (sortase) family protein
MNLKHSNAYIFAMVVTLILLNWDAVSWAFNYQEVMGLAQNFLNPYPDNKLLANASEGPAAPTENFQPQTIQNTPAPVQKPAVSVTPQQVTILPYFSADNTISIPSLNIDVPLVQGTTTDVNTLHKELDKGAVFYPGSVAPGQPGQMIVLGHSAPPGWPHIKHDWVFSDAGKLQPGDRISLNFNGKTYTYRVIQTDIVKKGQDVSAVGNGTNNILTIVSCWPPGKDSQRIAVSAELVN